MNPFSPDLKDQTPDDQMKLQNAYKNMMTPAGSDKARPPGWFIKSDMRAPAQPPPDAPDGKFVCTKLLEKGVISLREYLALCRAHAAAIFLSPRFCLWYLLYGKELVKAAESFDWENEGSAFIRQLKNIYFQFGIRAGIEFYKSFCVSLASKYAPGLPAITETRGSIFLTRWFWCSIPKFIWTQRGAL